LSIKGPAIRLRPEASVSFLMTCHELATNAAKYGALSVPDGQVDVSWTVQDDQLTFDWCESGGPAVAPPTRRGFGTDLITRGFARDVDGEASLDLAADGARYRLVAPLSKKIMMD
jgi:two-component sensor histidine kinase